MAINYRVGTIIIAAVTIIGTIFDSVQLFFITRDQNKNMYIYMPDVNVYRALTIVANVISLICATCLYFVISIEIKRNVKRRKFLLPYAIWGTILCIWKLTEFTILATKYGRKIDNVRYAIILLGAFVLFTFVCVELSYYRLLTHDNGSKLNSKSMVLVESPYKRRKSRPSVTGRVYYDDSDDEDGVSRKKSKKDHPQSNGFLSNKLKDINENVFMMT